MRRKPKPIDYLISTVVIGGLAVLGATHHKQPATASASTAPTGVDCSQSWNERLPGCWSEEKQRQRDAKDAEKKADMEAFVRNLADQARAQCDQPIGKMTPQDIEDCNRPGNRWLRDQQ